MGFAGEGADEIVGDVGKASPVSSLRSGNSRHHRLPFGLCLLLAFGVAVSRDGFSWIAPSSRGLQWALVLAAVLSAVMVVVGSAALRWEPTEQLPLALWPLRAWAPLVWPPLLLAALVLALSPGLRAGLPTPAWQAPIAALGVVALLAGGDDVGPVGAVIGRA